MKRYALPLAIVALTVAALFVVHGKRQVCTDGLVEQMFTDCRHSHDAS